MKESDDMFCNYDQYKDKEVVKKHEQLLKQLGKKTEYFRWNGTEKTSHWWNVATIVSDMI